MATSLSLYEERYECECGHVQNVSINDVKNQYCDEDVSGQLLDMDDSEAEGYGRDGCHVNIKVEIKCETCSEAIDVFVKVEACPVWYVLKRDCHIESFTNIKILAVLPSDEEPDTSLIGSFFNRDHDEWTDFDDLPNIQLNEEPTSGRSLRLHIIAKTKMYRRFCYLGLDYSSTGDGRIVRPLYRFHEGQCCWDQSLMLGDEYSFTVLESSDESLVTPLPHRNEDLLVHYQPASDTASNDLTSSRVFQELKNMAKTTVEDIFGRNIKQNEYVDEGTNCPSAGVLSCRGTDLELIIDPFDSSKRRVKIYGGYEPRITAIDARQLPEELPDKPTLVILGLARPFAGTEPNHFVPRRCYILVVRILQSP